MSRIKKKDIIKVQKRWGEGILKIRQAHLEGKDYRKVAIDHINTFYAYQYGEVLFKPTIAHIEQFRLDFTAALSYFIGGNSEFPEDDGFALLPWVNVEWESAGIKIFNDTAIAMGNYYFTPEAENMPPVKVEYSFTYIKAPDKKLRIVLHHSSYPYKPAKPKA
jgi:hypothetical protein